MPIYRANAGIAAAYPKARPRSFRRQYPCRSTSRAFRVKGAPESDQPARGFIGPGGGAGGRGGRGGGGGGGGHSGGKEEEHHR